MSGIIADNVGRSTGLIKSAGGGGKIGQVLQVYKSDTFTTSSTTAVDITDMTLDITCAATSSKVLVFFNLQVGNSSTVARSQVFLYRDSTQILMGDAEGSNRPRMSGVGYSNLDAAGHQWTIAGQYLDSPSSTSALTYKLQGRTRDVGSMYINREGDDTDSATRGRTASTLTLMEVLV